jgi:hypothetical protein
MPLCLANLTAQVHRVPRVGGVLPFTAAQDERPTSSASNGTSCNDNDTC